MPRPKEAQATMAWCPLCTSFWASLPVCSDILIFPPASAIYAHACEESFEISGDAVTALNACFDDSESAPWLEKLLQILCKIDAVLHLLAKEIYSIPDFIPCITYQL